MNWVQLERAQENRDRFSDYKNDLEMWQRAAEPSDHGKTPLSGALPQQRCAGIFNVCIDHIPPLAYAAFREACMAELQRRIDAVEREFAEL